MAKKSLDDISAQLSKKGDGWLEKISSQLDSKGVKGNNPFGGFQVPKLTEIAKGLFFGLAPSLIKKSVSGMQVFIDALDNMQLRDADHSLKIIKVVDGFSDAITNFGKIPWVKAFRGTLLMEMFVKKFVNMGLILGSREYLEKLEPFRRFGRAFGEPLRLISQALLDFGKVKWVKLFFGATLFEKIITSFFKMGKLAYTNKDSFKNLGEILNGLNEPLANFSETFSKIGNGLIKASVALLIMAGSLGLTAISLKQFAGVAWPDMLKGISALTIMTLGLYLLSKRSADAIKGAAAIAIVAGSLGLTAISMQQFAGVDLAKVAGSVGILAVIMGGLIAMGALLTGPQLGFVAIAAGIMALVGVAMIPFAYSLQKLSEVKWDMFDGIFTALSKLAAGVALLTFAIPAMLGLAIAGIPFAFAMRMLSKIDWEQFNGLGVQLTQAAGGILALSGALVAFAGAQVVSGIGNLLGKILRFGSDSPIQQLIKLAKHGYNLSILGTGVKDLATGLKSLAGINSELNILDNLADKFKGLNALDPTGIKAFAEGLNMLVTSLTALSQLDGKLNVLNNIPFDKLKSLSESIKPGSPLSQIVNGLQESPESKQTAALLKQGVASVAPTVGAELRSSGTSSTSPVVIINNSGGNVTNNSSTSSNVNNNGSTSTPIITASGSGMFTAE